MSRGERWKVLHSPTGWMRERLSGTSSDRFRDQKAMEARREEGSWKLRRVQERGGTTRVCRKLSVR